eukprot:1139252-Pelagomonas_calceolata.AAC.7
MKYDVQGRGVIVHRTLVAQLSQIGFEFLQGKCCKRGIVTRLTRRAPPAFYQPLKESRPPPPSSRVHCRT